MRWLLILLLLSTFAFSELYVADYTSELQVLSDSRPDLDIERKGNVAQVHVTSSVAQAELLHATGNLELEQVFSVALDDSVNQIGGPVSMGTGSNTVSCIIDTGINYSLPQFGSCTASYYAMNGTNITQVVESDHPYSNNENVTYTITVPGAEQVAVHFVNISLESFEYDNLDRVSILDASNITFAVYKDTVSDAWSPSVDGDTIKVQLTSDGSIQGYGFYIDKIMNGTTELTMNWSGCRVVGGYDFVNNDVDPRDDHGHGTHVAGIVASEHVTYTGVSESSNILVAKALNSTGNGYTSDVIEAIEWCTEQKLYHNVTSIVMSLGDGGKNDAYCSNAISSSISAAVDAGITVTVASGNDGYTDGIASPACVEDALPVGAVNDVNELVYNRGTILSVLAPGVDIVSAWYGGGNVGMSGTSMATPHVAGVVNLFQSWWYDLFGSYQTPSYLESRLNSTGGRVYDVSSLRNYSVVNITALFTPSMNYVGGSDNVNVSTILPVELTVEWNLSTYVNVNYSNGTTLRVLGSSYNITSNMSQSALYYGESSDGSNSWYMPSRNVTFMVGPLINDGTRRVCSGCFINTTFIGTNISLVTLNISNGTYSLNYTYAPLVDTYLLEQPLSLLDGLYNVTLVSTDSVGTTNTTFELTVDTIAPIITSLNYSVGPYYSSSNLTFNVSVSDGDVVMVTDETGVNVTYSVPGTISTASRNNHVLANYTFTVTDTAGNTVGNTTQLFITNRAISSVTMHSPNGTIELGDATILNASATDPDNDTLVYSWSTGNQSANGSYTTMVFDTIGNVTVLLEVSDANTSYNVSNTFYVNDTVAPVIVDDSIASSYHLAYGDVEFNVTYLENSGLQSAYINISGTSSVYTNDSGTVLIFSPDVVVGTNNYVLTLIELSYNETVNETGTFTVETCSDGIKNGPEYGVDCGGSCPDSCTSSSSSSSSGGGGGGSSSSSSSTSVSVSRSSSSSSTSTTESVKDESTVAVSEPMLPVNLEPVSVPNYTKSIINNTIYLSVTNESLHRVLVDYPVDSLVKVYVNDSGTWTLFTNVSVVSGYVDFYAGVGTYKLELMQTQASIMVEPSVSLWERDWFNLGLSNTQKMMIILFSVLFLLSILYYFIKPKEQF